MPVDKSNSDNISACSALGEQLSAYLDGELNEADTAAVEAHLRDCPDCAKLCSALRTLRIDLAGAQLDPPPELHERIMAKVHRENRLRKLRRFTAAASIGVAAMFCFVIIGGSMTRMHVADNAEAPGAKMMAMDGAAECGEEMQYSLHNAVPEAMTGGVIDTTLEVSPTIAGTGIVSDNTEPRGVIFSASTDSPETKASTVKTPETAAPATSAPAAPVQPGVISIKLPEDMRDLSRLDTKASIQGLSTTQSEASSTSVNNKATFDDSSLAAMLANPDARLADEQIGTLCVIELDDGRNGVRCLVYDLITGDRLTLAEFLAVPNGPALLGAEEDTPYRPTAAGLCLQFTTGEKCIVWDENDTLSDCVTRYAMTKQPLCGAR